ncbi:MAG: glutamine synthetase III, partial [Ileibacterium sp.]|nr:glutamine synthetase III [Ileibacterium sp.]
MEKMVTEYFGENVFDDSTMKERLPKETYKELRKTIDDGLPLNRKIANAVAHAMKVWALEKGATH